jgi:signal transduction histidine kinase
MVIKAQAERLLEESETDDEREVAKTILDAADRLESTSRKTNKIKDVIEADDGLHAFDVSDMVADAVARAEAAHPDATFRVESDCSGRAYGHSNVPTALENLLDNAARHTDTDAPHVAVTAERKNGHFEISIEDDGPGIADHEIEALENGEETQLLHSHGAGLWLSKFIVDRSDGDLTVERTASGTKVTIEFPSKRE